MKLRNKLAVGLVTMLAGAAAFADAPPPPGTQAKYELKLSADVSSVLMDTVQFENVRDVQLPADAGGCTVQEKSVSHYAGSIACKTSEFCFGKARPRCQVSTNAYRGKSSADFIQVLSETAIP